MQLVSTDSGDRLMNNIENDLPKRGNTQGKKGSQINNCTIPDSVIASRKHKMNSKIENILRP